MARYKQLLFYAKKLPPMPQEEHTEENKVKGCVSQEYPRHLLSACVPGFSSLEHLLQ